MQFGGQTPLKRARELEANGVPIIGTSPDMIDAAEDRAEGHVQVGEQGRARLAVADGARVTHAGAPVTALALASDAEPGGPTVLALGSMRKARWRPSKP